MTSPPSPGRRAFLMAGGTSYSGMDLAARAASARPPAGCKDTSVILIWLDGGPGHMDMYDM